MQKNSLQGAVETVKSRSKKLAGILLFVLILVYAIIPASAKSNTEELSQADIKEKIMAMQTAYPDGMAWTNQSPTPAYLWVFPGSLWSMGGCAAFAAIIQDAVFGPINSVPPTWQRINGTCNTKEVHESPVQYKWENLWPGDIIRFPSHAVIVVEKHSDHVVIAEGNYLGTIKWGRTLSRAGIENTAKYVLTRYSKSERLMPYIDLPERTHWSWTAVSWSILRGYTDPITPMEFKPKNECTRGEMITFIWKAFGSPEPECASTPFTDVPKTASYHKAVYWAYEHGITAGTSKTAFSPETITTRAHAITFLWRAAGNPEASIGRCPFCDVQNSKYYYPALLWAYENRITSGTSSTTFSPDSTCTRAEAIAFLYRAAETGYITPDSN